VFSCLKGNAFLFSTIEKLYGLCKDRPQAEAFVRIMQESAWTDEPSGRRRSLPGRI